MTTKFKPGDRVVMTEKGIRQGLQGKRNRRWGVVKSVNLIAPYVRVQREGIKGSSLWHVDFWQHDDPAAVVGSREWLERRAYTAAFRPA